MSHRKNTSPDTGRDSTNRTYNAARAEWHRHRAAVSTDRSARLLHEKFAALYLARAGSKDLTCRDAAQPCQL